MTYKKNEIVILIIICSWMKLECTYETHSTSNDQVCESAHPTFPAPQRRKLRQYENYDLYNEWDQDRKNQGRREGGGEGKLPPAPNLRGAP